MAAWRNRTEEPGPVQEKSEARREKEAENARDLTLKVLGMAILLGLLAVVVFSLRAEHMSDGLRASSFGMLVGLASLTVGGLFGFLFGIPRSLQRERPTGQAMTANRSDQDGGGAAAGSKQPGAQGGEVVGRFTHNTNLEEISDWLTKILVGAGLAQLAVFPGKLARVADYLKVGLFNDEPSKVFALVILVYFTVCGFLVSYLWTRLILLGQFELAGLRALIFSHREETRRALGETKQLVTTLSRRLVFEDYLEDLARIMKKESQEGEKERKMGEEGRRGLCLICADVDDLKKHVKGRRDAESLRGQVLELLHAALEQSAGSLHEKHDTYSLVPPDPDRVTLIRTPEIEKGLEIAKSASRSFINATQGFISGAHLTSSFGVVCSEVPTDVSEDDLLEAAKGLHDRAMAKLREAKDEKTRPEKEREFVKSETFQFKKKENKRRGRKPK